MPAYQATTVQPLSPLRMLSLCTRADLEGCLRVLCASRRRAITDFCTRVVNSQAITTITQKSRQTPSSAKGGA
jgi:hypothetical protein